MIKKILNVLSYILIGALLVIVGLLVYNKVFNKTKLIGVGNFYVFKILTGSMEPTIHTGDYILIRKQKNYNVKDVVTFEEDGYYVTHRIINKNGNTITTKGDANNTPDAPFDENKIVGKYIYKSSLLTFVFNNYYYFIVLIFVLIILSIIFQGPSEDKNIKEEINKEEESKENKL